MPPAAAVAPARLWSGRSGEPVVETATFAVLVLLAAGKTLGANWSECELTPHLNCSNEKTIRVRLSLFLNIHCVFIIDHLQLPGEGASLHIACNVAGSPCKAASSLFHHGANPSMLLPRNV